MSINLYLTGAEVEQNVTTASVAKVLTDGSTSDIWANYTSVDNGRTPDRIFTVDWSLSNFVPFFQIQFDHNDEDAYATFDNANGDGDPDPASDFDVNVTYRINGGLGSSEDAGFFNINSVNLYNTPIDEANGTIATALSTSPSEIAGATLPAVFFAHGYERATDHTPKNLYVSDLANDLFGNAGTAELLSNEKTIADQINTAGVSMKTKLDALINDQNDATNSLATGKNNSTLIVGKLLRAMMNNEFIDSDGNTVDTVARVNAALAKWKAHDPSDKEIIDDNGHSYTVWETNSNGADYFNLGSCLRVGEQLRLRVKFTVRDSNNNPVAHGTPGPTVFSAVDSSGAAENRTHDTKIHEFCITLKAN